MLLFYYRPTVRFAEKSRGKCRHPKHIYPCMEERTIQLFRVGGEEREKALFSGCFFPERAEGRKKKGERPAST